MPKRIFLEGDRINLKEIMISDARLLFRYAKNKEIIGYTDIERPISFTKICKFIRHAKNEIKKRKGYQLGIVFKEINEVIGVIGLTNLDKHKKAEVSYWIGKKYWSRGFGKEAVKLIVNFGFKKLKLNRIYAKVEPQNHASRKILEKNRFSYEGTLRESIYENKKFIDLLVYSILKREYIKKIKNSRK